jgi:hypothetical protein|tara:strand:- start:3014 stop:3346 length:333 start_codon:yes stop_codon:yes gene_type:complete
MKTFAFDLDNTLVKTIGKDYENSTPIPKAIEKVNRLFNDGHKILIESARGASSGIDWLTVTIKQLKEFGIPYHHVRVGVKATADYFIDDKGINAQDWMDDEEAALAKVIT